MAIKDPELLTEADFPVAFGRYVLTGLLGEGGMGRVFRATLQGSGGFEKEVAVKVVRTSAVRQNPNLNQALLIEAQLGARLNHQYVVMTTDFAEIDGVPMIAMELLRGLPLDKFLKLGTLAGDQLVEMGRHVAEGLHYIHEFEDGAAGTALVHRDIKPSNIFLGRDGVTKILDFGIAKASEGYDQGTATGLAKGTIGFMSPEQIEGDPLDGRSDIFSLGVLLYETSVGDTLFRGHSYIQVMRAIDTVEQVLAKRGAIEQVDQVVLGLGPIVERCLRRDRDARYPDAAELAHALRTLGRSLPESGTLKETIRGAMSRTGAPATESPRPITAADSGVGGTRVVVQGQSGGGLDGTRVVEVDSRAAEKEAAKKAAAEKAAAEKVEAEKAAAKKAAADRAGVAARVAERAAAKKAAADRAGVAARVAERAEKAWTQDNMVRIEPGTFTMGSPKVEEGGYSNEVQHKVTFTHGFLLQRTPVTQAQYQALMGANPSSFTGDDQRPVENVSWFDAIKFANALSRKHGLKPCYDEDGTVLGGGSIYECEGYRLPTEAEWEYAARAGTIGARYGELEDIAWYDESSGNKTHPVGKKKPNAFGLYDMLGNVWEWCHDWYGDYPTGSQTNPEGPRAGSDRVFRGGSWRHVAVRVRAAFRYDGDPSVADDYYGFRLARSAP